MNFQIIKMLGTWNYYYVGNYLNCKIKQKKYKCRCLYIVIPLIKHAITIHNSVRNTNTLFFLNFDSQSTNTNVSE